MTSEYELNCATCGSSLARSEVSAETLGLSAVDVIEVAECSDCGSRYFPEATLERLDSEQVGQPEDDRSGRQV